MSRIKSAGVEKPEKPYPGFPLFSHGNGQWAKKIDGKLQYFGRWTPEDPGWQAALANYEESQKPVATPGVKSKRLTLEAGLNKFLHSRRKLVENGELAERSWGEYKSTAAFLVRHFGREAYVDSLGPNDYQSFRQYRSKTRDVTSLGSEIQRVRTMLTWIGSNTSAPAPDFGSDFRKPGKRSVKAATRQKMESEGIESRSFTPEQIHWILSECGLQLRAMTLLGINAAYYPSDCDAIKPFHLRNLPTLKMPRVKNEEDREAYLWPETIEAIEQWRGSKACKLLDSEFVFRRPGDLKWNDNAHMASKRFTAAMRAAGIATGSFRWLRNTFETIAGETGDQVAVNEVMGHEDSSMAAVYRQFVQPERIEKVCMHVRSWLYD